MSTWYIVDARFSFNLEVYKKRRKWAKNVEPPQLTLSYLALGSCGLRQEMGPTLTFHLVGLRVGGER